MKHTAITLATQASLFLLTAPVTFAAGQPINPCPKDPGGNGFNKLCDRTSQINFGNVIQTAVTVLLIFAVLLALFFLIFGGIRWILSGGDKAKVETARNTIVAAIIGLIVAFVSFFILQTVLNLFGLGNLFDLRLPTLS